jgi:hypothetical protein
MIKNPTLIKLRKLSDVPQTRRNFECPEYNDCLTDAAFQDLDLHCHDCPLRSMKQNALITELEIFGCISLINSVFVSR